MLDLKAKFGFDRELADNGVWFKFEGARLKIASTKSSEYQEGLVNNAIKSQASKRQKSDSNPFEEIPKLVAKYILLDWEGIFCDGKEVAYSEKEALALFKEYPDFLNHVLECSQDLASYQEEDEKEDLGK